MALDQSSSGCRFDFEIAGVPEVANVTLEIGRRGRLTFALDEIRKAGGTFEANLGLPGQPGRPRARQRNRDARLPIGLDCSIDVSGPGAVR